MKTNKIVNAMNYVDDNYIDSANKKSAKVTHPLWTRWIAVAAAFVLVFTGVFAITGISGNAVESIVALDVNPSIEIEINKNQKVLAVNALNEDGNIVLGEMNLSRVDLEVAINAIIGSMLKNGYLSNEQNSILVSVNSKKQSVSEELKTKITADIESLIGSANLNASVISQTFTKDAGIKDQAQTNNISCAKATLINRIVAKGITNSNGVPYTYETLAGLNVNELKMICDSKNVTIDGVQSSGTAVDQSLIGNEKALEIAIADAGATRETATLVEIEMDYEKGVMLYSIDFIFGQMKYEYEIDALTGKIVEFEKEPVDNHTHNHNPAVPETNATNPNISIPTPSITSDEAIKIALENAGLTLETAKELKYELENEKGNPIFEVDFKSETIEYEYDICGVTGKIIKVKKENIYTAPKTDTPKVETVITRKEALNIALDLAGATKDMAAKIEVEQDFDKGISKYEVVFVFNGYEYDIEINASTGSVIKNEKEPIDDHSNGNHGYGAGQNNGGNHQQENSGSTGNTSEPTVTELTREQAVEIALKHAGASIEKVRELETEYDVENNKPIIQVEFEFNGMEYEYEICRHTGEILFVEKEPND